MTDSLGQAKRYEVHVIEEAADTAAQALEGQTEDAVQTVRVYEISTFDDSTREGDTVYSQRNLLITSDMIRKAKAILYGEHADNIQILLVAYGSLEPAVNDTTQRKSGSTICLSAGIYQRSLFTGTAVEG